MADEELLQKIHGLGDLDLAALLCLVSREHCIISTEPDALDDLVEELQLVASQTFNLKSTTFTCTAQTTLEDFAAAILAPPKPSTTPRSSSPLLQRSRTPGGNNSNNNNDSYFGSSTRRALSPLSQLSSGTTNQTTAAPQPQPQIANVVLARDLDRAPKAVQIQALELLRMRRIITRHSVQTAPKRFLFVAVLGAPSGGAARLTSPHLNDFFYISHWHDPLDGFAHLEEEREEDDGGEGEDGDDDAGSVMSAESVVRWSAAGTPGLERRAGRQGTLKRGDGDGDGDEVRGLFDEGDVAKLAMESRQVHVDVEVLRYQMNVISFLRMHRAVAGGIAPVATRHFDQLLRCMALLHGLEYATPAMVGLAAKKIYMHRIRIVTPEKERSMQWGSQLAAIEQLLDGVGPEDVIEDVVGMVAVPL